MATDVLPPPSTAKSRPALDVPIAAVNPLVSIVIPCCGMLEYTELCVPSVLRYSRHPFELIFLDIGSLDGTAEYLKGLAAGLTQLRVEVIRTPTDLGIPKACQDALNSCRGEYIVLLNNDTLVTRGWLGQLISLTSLTASMGIVGPMSNYAAVGQLVETVPYRSGLRRSTNSEADATETLIDVDAVQSFADQFREANKGKYIHVERLGGFCMLLKREVFKRLDQQGDLNQWTDLGLFDSDILSVKARQFGYNLAVCRDLFIHHFGSRIGAHGAPASATSGSAPSEAATATRSSGQGSA